MMRRGVEMIGVPANSSGTMDGVARAPAVLRAPPAALASELAFASESTLASEPGSLAQGICRWSPLNDGAALLACWLRTRWSR